MSGSWFDAGLHLRSRIPFPLRSWCIQRLPSTIQWEAWKIVPARRRWQHRWEARNPPIPTVPLQQLHACPSWFLHLWWIVVLRWHLRYKRRLHHWQVTLLTAVLRSRSDWQWLSTSQRAYSRTEGYCYILADSLVFSSKQVEYMAAGFSASCPHQGNARCGTAWKCSGDWVLQHPCCHP